MDGTLDDLWEMVGILHQDFIQACNNLEAKNAPYNRRAYVRTVFAAIEAIVFHLKQLALQKRAKGLFSQAEIALLLEETYSLDKGKAATQTRFLPLDQNFLFAIDMYCRATKSPYVAEKGDKWEGFKKAIAVRNRITHPKCSKLLEISDDELEQVCAAYNWVVRSIIDSVCGSVNALRSHVDAILKRHGLSSMFPDQQEK